MRDFRIQLKTTALNSGKCQVKFFIRQHGATLYYGYLLAEPEDPLDQVVSRIQHRFQEADSPLALRQPSLMALNKEVQDDFLIFSA